MTRVVWSALAIVLMLTVAPATVFAQSLVCHAIRRGESATQVARRVTGSSRNTYQDWFQIRNAASKFVPKSQYNRIRAGWQACVLKPAIQRASSNAELIAPEAADASEASTSPEALETLAPPATLAIADAAASADDSLQIATPGAVRGIERIDLRMLWLGAAMVVPWFGWRILDGHLVRRKTTTIVMQHFASRFVQEFERPLVWSDLAERPLRSRVRYNTRRRRLDILLAPGEGRRYPNLSDHKKNVEYDVERVLHALADASFVSGPLSTHDGWVVVPIRFKAGPQQPGVTCISSF